MRHFKGAISTDVVGGEVEFEFETEEAFNWVNWYYEEINN